MLDPIDAPTQKELTNAAVKERLMLTPEERIEAHEKARLLLLDLKKTGEQQRARSQAAAQATT